MQRADDEAAVGSPDSQTRGLDKPASLCCRYAKHRYDSQTQVLANLHRYPVFQGAGGCADHRTLNQQKLRKNAIPSHSQPRSSTLSICIVFETSAGTLGLLANTRTQPPVLRCAIFDAAEIPSLATTHAVHVPASARSWSLV